ncbi:DUF2207 domain-containing protein [Aequorivita marina]|uniref:DUF2207 domain-containing protein n=1 Tax=Aequorivita marina TaxID=3073654 RepID=UPI0028759419|nr:DUF2207 domain-containing protein [Aequorivita sp. S2608]MDS1299245.1 DUF2207 domain-containing protein [Aequorivita sp. S2608]
MLIKNFIGESLTYHLYRSLLLLLFGLLFFVKGFSQGFEVSHASVDIYISAEGYFDVVENYDLNFTTAKHGIYRNIQTKYDLLTAEGNQEKRKIKIRKIKVPGHKFKSDPDFVQKINDKLQIKIGDKNKKIIGPQHYEIKYRVYNAFLFEAEQIHFYWNIKPSGWNAFFQELDFTIHPPENIDVGLDNFFVYAGETGDSNESESFNISYTNGSFTATSKTDFLSVPGESVTVLLKLPPNSIEEIKPLWPFWTDYGWTLLLAGLIFSFYRLWKKYGKDDEVVAAISYFPPNGVDPAMAGFLIDDSGDTEDLISLIPYWGSRGIIKMEEIPKKGWFGKSDTKLIQLRPLPVGTPDYEQKIYDGLFGSSPEAGENEVLISSLKNSFYTKMSSAKSLLTQKAQVYYDPTAKKAKTWSIVGVIFFAILLFLLFLFVWGIFAAIAVIPVAIFLLFMTAFMVKKNAKGNKMLSELKGFKQFIKVAEENKLRMLLKDSPTYFETTMGYALAFGLFSQWAKKFEALNLQPPSWYSSTAGVMSMNNFSNSFADTMSSAKSTMVSSPSSSSSGGGGSSGGGFGGGGGGSW